MQHPGASSFVIRRRRLQARCRPTLMFALASLAGLVACVGLDASAGAGASAPTYYFSDCEAGAAADCAPGSNSNAGTQAAPKRTLAALDLNTLPAGTQLLFKRGGAWANFSIRLRNLNATPSKPIVFDAYGTGPAPWLKTANGNAFGINKWNDTVADGGYTLRNLKLDGLGSGQWGVLLADATRNVTVENVEITGFTIGIHSITANHLTVRNSNIHHNREHGMLGGGDNMLLEGNTVEGNNMDGGTFEHGFYLSHGTNVVLRGNQFMRNSAPGGVCNGGNLTLHGQLENWLIEGNRIEQDAALGGCYGLSITTGYSTAEWFRNFTVRGNTIINVGNCGVCAGSAPGIVVENNIIVNLRDAPQIGIQIPTGKPGPGDEADTGAIVRNNTIFQRRAGLHSVGVQVTQGSQLQVVSNLVYFGVESNPVTACFAHDSASSYAAFDHNLCYHARGKGAWSATHATLATARDAGFDRRGKSDDPRLVDAPSLANKWRCLIGSGSPAIAAGHPVRSSPLARTVQNAPDIGGCGRAPGLTGNTPP